jgi:hypothetical protein
MKLQGSETEIVTGSYRKLKLFRTSDTIFQVRQINTWQYICTSKQQTTDKLLQETEIVQNI